MAHECALFGLRSVPDLVFQLSVATVLVVGLTMTASSGTKAVQFNRGATFDAFRAEEKAATFSPAARNRGSRAAYHQRRTR